MTQPYDRRLTWPGCPNARDLGGLPTQGGGRVRPLALVRTDHLGRLTAEGRAAFDARRVALIVDLRGPAEVARAPSPYADTPAYRHLPVEGDDPATRARLRAEPELSGIYRAILDLAPERFAAVLAAIAEAPEGTVVVHCHAGKDRTGLVVALALAVAGVDPDVVAADYAETDACLADHYAAELALLHDAGARERLRSLQHTRPETMREVFAHLEGRYGGAEGYLRAGGATDAQLARVRDRLRG